MDTDPESVHLCVYPAYDAALVDEGLEEGMQQIRDLVEVGRALRSKIGIKVRYPLSKAVLICSKETEDAIDNIIELLREEINVKEIEYHRDSSKYMDKTVKPNFSVLGPRLKEKAGMVTKQLETIDKQQLYEELKQQGSYRIKVNDEQINFTLDDFEVVEKEKEGIARTETGSITLLIDTILTDDLKAEGFSREIVRRIQSMRKELDLAVEQEITTILEIPADNQKMIEAWLEYIKDETRSQSLSFQQSTTGALVKTWKIDDEEISIGISPSS